MPNNNSDSLVDRILRGDFTENLKSDAPDIDPDPSGDDEEIQYAEEEGQVEDDDYVDAEEEEEEEGYSPDPDADFPSDEYCEEYMEEHGIDAVPELAASIGAKYTKFRNDNDINNSAKDQPKVNMNKNTVNNSESSAMPKNATTPSTNEDSSNTATAKRRGRPSKLVGHEAEVARLYGEGVSTKLISDKFACSISSVINCLRAQNVEIRPKGRRKGS
jgi:hypothetical protein